MNPVFVALYETLFKMSGEGTVFPVDDKGALRACLPVRPDLVDAVFAVFAHEVATRDLAGRRTIGNVAIYQKVTAKGTHQVTLVARRSMEHATARRIAEDIVNGLRRKIVPEYSRPFNLEQAAEMLANLIKRNAVSKSERTMAS